MGFNRAERTAQYWKMLTLLLVSVAVLLLAALYAPEFANSFLIAALPIAVAALLFSLHQRNQMQLLREELEQQLPFDPVTKAARKEWFEMMLEQECRRAMREFSPLTVVRILPLDKHTSLQRTELIEILQQRMTRPGDLLGLYGSLSLSLLLPSTNEQVSAFAERLFRQVNQQQPANLLSYTFQPSSDLGAIKVHDLLNTLEARLDPALAEPTLIIEAESFDMPSVTYSL